MSFVQPTVSISGDFVNVLIPKGLFVPNRTKSQSVSVKTLRGVLKSLFPSKIGSVDLQHKASKIWQNQARSK